VSKPSSIPGARTHLTRKVGDAMILFPLCSNYLLLFNLQEATGTFDDLGKLLLGGVAAAIVVAIGFTFIRLRIRDKRPQAPSFISISSTESEERR
jgi:hypothetical protein